MHASHTDREILEVNEYQETHRSTLHELQPPTLNRKDVDKSHEKRRAQVHNDERDEVIDCGKQKEDTSRLPLIHVRITALHIEHPASQMPLHTNPYGQESSFSACSPPAPRTTAPTRACPLFGPLQST